MGQNYRMSLNLHWIILLDVSRCKTCWQKHFLTCLSVLRLFTSSCFIKVFRFCSASRCCCSKILSSSNIFAILSVLNRIWKHNLWSYISFPQIKAIYCCKGPITYNCNISQCLTKITANFKLLKPSNLQQHKTNSKRLHYYLPSIFTM